MSSFHETILENIILSPSSHNTQPWDIEIEGNRFNFYINKKRRLLVADPTDRELYMSIGCAIANCLITAKSLGYEVRLTFFPNTKSNIHVATAEIADVDTEFPTESDLVRFIPKRLSNRSKYLINKKVPSVFVDEAVSLMSAWDTQFVFINNSDKKKKFAELTRSAMKKAIENRAFRDELTKWIHHNWTKKPDGMPGYVSGMSGPQSILFPALIHSPEMPDLIADSEYDLICGSPAVGLLLIEEDSKLNWIKSGISLEYLWLNATKYDLGMSLLSGSVEMEEEREQVRKELETQLLPTSFFRIGFPTKKAHPSPRREISDVLIKNKTKL